MYAYVQQTVSNIEIDNQYINTFNANMRQTQQWKIILKDTCIHAINIYHENARNEI